MMEYLEQTRAVIRQTYKEVLPGKFNSIEADAMLLTIKVTESGPDFTTRQQKGGPAHGLWQFELAGTAGVIRHSASARYVDTVCYLLGVPVFVQTIYKEFLTNDVLACAFARLLLYTDAAPLPALHQPLEAAHYYKRTWKPGAYREQDFINNYKQVMDFLT